VLAYCGINPISWDFWREMGFRDFPGKFGIFLYFMENFGISPKKLKIA